MDPAGPLPCSQDPAICTCTEPGEFTPYRPVKIHFNIVQSMPGLHSRVFLLDFPTRPRVFYTLHGSVEQICY